jgi:hypothetical protein
MLCDVEVQYPPSVVSDGEKTVENAEPHGVHCEEIHRGNRFPMIAKNR